MQRSGLNRRLFAWVMIAVFAIFSSAVPAAPKNLLISVIFGKDLRAGRRASESSQSRLYQTQDRRETQQLRVLEGHTAHITYSESVPYPIIFAGAGVSGAERLYGLDYRDLESGFNVSPRLDKGRLLLDISAQDQHMSSRGGDIIEGSSLQTTVSGELGQWIQLSGSFELVLEENPNTVRSSDTASRADDYEIWVRVDRLD